MGIPFMNCPECGNPVEEGAQFCPKCYARIEPPGFWRKVLSLFQAPKQKPRRVLKINKTLTIKTKDKGGQVHEYHSLAEAPPELRSRIEALETEALQGKLAAGSDPAHHTKVTSVIRVKDASGNERTYHSLEELPPELRAAVERAQKGR